MPFRTMLRRAIRSGLPLREVAHLGSRRRWVRSPARSAPRLSASLLIQQRHPPSENQPLHLLSASQRRWEGPLRPVSRSRRLVPLARGRHSAQNPIPLAHQPLDSRRNHRADLFSVNPLRQGADRHSDSPHSRHLHQPLDSRHSPGVHLLSGNQPSKPALSGSQRPWVRSPTRSVPRLEQVHSVLPHNSRRRQIHLGHQHKPLQLRIHSVNRRKPLRPRLGLANLRKLLQPRPGLANQRRLPQPRLGLVNQLRAVLQLPTPSDNRQPLLLRMPLVSRRQRHQLLTLLEHRLRPALQRIRSANPLPRPPPRLAPLRRPSRRQHPSSVVAEVVVEALVACLLRPREPRQRRPRERRVKGPTARARRASIRTSHNTAPRAQTIDCVCSRAGR